MLLRIIILQLILVLPLFAQERLDPIKKLRITQSDTKVKITWRKPDNSRKFRVVIKDALKNVIYKTNTRKRKIRIPIQDNFTPVDKYRVFVWAKSVPGYRTSKKRTKRFFIIPKLANVSGPTTLTGSSLWLFYKEDSDGDGVVSSEKDGDLLIADYDIDTNDGTVTWTTLLDGGTGDYGDFADHWHIYHKDHHYIVISENTATKSYLLKVNNDFSIEKVVTVADDDSVETEIGDTSVRTNDMFLVADDTGVTVGHFVPGHGHQLYRYTGDLTLIEEKTIGGGDYAHGNGASVIETNSGFLLYSSSSLDPEVKNPLLKIKFDSDWEAKSIVTLIDEDNIGIAMPTVILFDSGYTIVTLRERNLDTVEEGGDAGDVVRYVFSKKNKMVSSEVLASDDANRPHTLLNSDNQLITTWDEEDGIMLQVDELR